MKRPWLLLLAIVILLFCARSHAATCTGVSAGASVATINSALSACASAGGGTVAFGAGTYTGINGTINLPCSVSITGPVVGYSQTHYQTAILQGSGGVSNPLHTTAGCSANQSISYLEWNGEQPSTSSGAGGFIYVTPGTTNLTINNNWMHGANAVSYAGAAGAMQILIDGTGSSPLTQNITITLNEFGAESYSDCGYPNGAMNEPNTEGGGGFCNGVTLQGQEKNVSIDHNIFHYMEQGGKVTEASSGHGNTQNFTFSYNSMTYLYRIFFETQSNNYDTSHPTLQYLQYNYSGNRANTGGGGQQDFEFSVANGCGNPPATPNCTAHLDYNIDVQNVGNSIPSAGNEFWGDSNSTANYNLFQGYVAGAGGGIDWSQSGQFTFNNNTFNINSGSGTACQPAPSGGYWNFEKQGGVAPYGVPTCTGNTYSNTGTGTYSSAQPTISPASGHFAGTQTVTLTNTGTNRDTNTSIWYTTNGSTPVPGTATLYTGPFTVSATTTVRAVGMWGAINQPYSYPSNYGYVPSAVTTATYTAGAQYYLSTTGSDSNAGTSTGSPWLTPNHSVNCGDTITAASGNYSASNFGSGHWGTVTCAAGNNVAWLQCATFDTCKITATGSDAMWVDKSYWGIQGWENSTNTTTNGACFHAGPSGGSTVHHIIFANDVANACMGGGFNSYNASTSASVDYITYVGDVAYNAAQGNGACYSGFNIYQPIASDTGTGTHNYIAGSFSYNNVDASPCSGGTTTDGEGFNYDTWDFDQGGGTAYVQQGAMENNIAVNNGSDGFIVENNKTGASSAPVYLKNNTAYGNSTAMNLTYPIGKGEIYAEAAYTVTASYDLAMTSRATGSGGDPIYAFSVANGNNTVSVATNWLYSAAGNTTYISNSGSFAYGTNTTGTNPAFTSVTIPGAPSCSGTANVPACMATMISNFTPTASGSVAYGRQPVSSTSVTDALYPTWLCNVNLPSGLVTPGCGGGTTPTLTGGFQGNGSTPCTGGGVNTIAVGASPIQQTACGTYSDGNTRTLPDAYGNTAVWSSSNSAELSVSNTGSITGIATGTANSQVTSSPGGTPFNIYTWTVTAGSNPTLTGGFLGNGSTPCTTQGVNTQIVGTAAIQFTACGTYSDGNTRTLPDSYGNTAVWTSSNSAIMTVSSSGLANCVAVGSANVQVTSSPGSVVFNVWGMGCQAPTQSGGYLGNTGSISNIAVGGGTIPFTATVYYSNSPAVNTLPDGFGNSVTSWTITPGSSTCGTMSSNVFTPTTAGTCTVVANCSACAVALSTWGMTVTGSATISSVSLATTGNVTGLLVSNTNQLIATCHYSDSSTTNCTTTDSHGNIAGSWTSTTPAKATVSTSGLATGVAAGSTTFTAAAGGHTSAALPLTILPNGVYTITVHGPVRFTGTVRF